jgi:hypothetical protein
LDALAEQGPDDVASWASSLARRRRVGLEIDATDAQTFEAEARAWAAALEDEDALLRFAREDESVEDCKRLLVAGLHQVDLNYTRHHREYENSGYTALHIAVVCGQLEKVKLLIDYGADLDLEDGSGRKALDIAETKKLFPDENSDGVAITTVIETAIEMRRRRRAVNLPKDATEEQIVAAELAKRARAVGLDPQAAEAQVLTAEAEADAALAAAGWADKNQDEEPKDEWQERGRALVTLFQVYDLDGSGAVTKEKVVALTAAHLAAASGYSTTDERVADKLMKEPGKIRLQRWWSS